MEIPFVLVSNGIVKTKLAMSTFCKKTPLFLKVTPVGSVQLTVQMVIKGDIQPEKRMIIFADDNVKTFPSESNLSLDLKGESLRVVVVGVMYHH